MTGGVIIAGGGTGGHLFPGVAVGQALQRLTPGISVTFVGTGKALESRVLARAGFRLEALKVTGFRGRGLYTRIRSLLMVPPALLRALALLRRLKPRLVLAVGGYAALPLGLAARLAGLPLAVQEQNAVPGLVNRVLGRWAKMVFTSFPGAEDHFPAGKCRLTGNPVRAEVLEQARLAAPERPQAGREFRVLVVGGSQGAASLNRAVPEALAQLGVKAARISLVHQCGEGREEEVRRAYSGTAAQVRVAGFINDMGRQYGVAHLVICRSGAGTVSEVAAVGRASILVPYPHAAGDHQTRNALALVKAGAALTIPDAELSGPALAGALLRVMGDDACRVDMEGLALGLARPSAAEDIANACLRMMEGVKRV